VKLFTILILLHNVFGATQDVAIDETLRALDDLVRAGHWRGV